MNVVELIQGMAPCFTLPITPGLQRLLERYFVCFFVFLQKIFFDIMAARKTIVFLVIGWVIWIVVNFIEKTVSALRPGHFYWKNMLSQEYIDILWDELNNTDFCFFKKLLLF